MTDPQPTSIQVHPLAALQEATFDNDTARNRRLILANDIYILTQQLAERDTKIAELEARLAVYEPPEDATPETDQPPEQEAE